MEVAMTDAFAAALDARAIEVLDRCTSCGKCYEVCPMPEPAGIAQIDAQAQAAGILDLIRGGAGTPEAGRWAQVCSGSGSCITACPEGVNPRFMLSLARLALQRRSGADERRAKGAAGFSTMGRSVRVLSRIQLSPDVLARFRGEPATASDPEVVFYTGCNVLKTPHIVLLCLDILDALGVSYHVMGGPGDCCGVIQYRTADTLSAGRIAYRTTDRFAASGARKVLAWCPTCQVQLGENVLPGREADGATPYGMEPLVVYLAERLNDLKALMKHRVEKRVGLHEHPGVPGVSEAAVRLLKAIPGVEYVDLEQPRVGYMCNTLQPLPQFKREVHRQLLEAAAAARVDVLAGVYHACHRELCSHEIDWPFEVVNFLELVGASMGLTREDRFKRLKKMQDVDAVVADVMDLAERHRLKLDEVRDIVESHLLAEQPLALRGGTASGRAA
jgi:heterodisulfide reductase subunit D